MFEESTLSREPTRHAASLQPPPELRWRWSALVATVTFVVTLLIIGGFVGFVSSPTWLELYRMQSRGRETVAHVTRIDLANHHSCEFHYTVTGLDYSSTASCEANSAGARIVVTYDPRDPTQVTTRNPSDELRDDLIVLLIGAIGFSSGITYSVRRAYRWFAANSR